MQAKLLEDPRQVRQADIRNDAAFDISGVANIPCAFAQLPGGPDVEADLQQVLS